MPNNQIAFQTLSESIIQNLQTRNIEGYYFKDSKSCVDAIMKMLPSGSRISWGGSESLKECGLMDALKKGTFELIDRAEAKTPEEARQIYAKAVLADYYFMSSNAITLDGELLNIDGNSNRVGCLVHGPSHVFIIIGRNKLVNDVESGFQRVRYAAAPANAKRLGRQTPCQITGRCGECFSPDCMCNQFVITRRSGHPGRIKVFLVAEDLGY